MRLSFYFAQISCKEEFEKPFALYENCTSFRKERKVAADALSDFQALAAHKVRVMGLRPIPRKLS